MATVRINTNGDDNNRRPIAPIVSSNDIITEKESFGTKFTKAFVSDSAKDVGYYILDGIVDWAKNTVISSLEMIFFGEARRGTRPYMRYDRTSDYGYRSYKSYYQSEYPYGSSGAPIRTPSHSYDRRFETERIDYRNIIIRDYDDAVRVVKSLRDSIERYKWASKGELLSLCDVTPESIDFDYGWVHQGQIGMVYRADCNGYLIDVDEAKHRSRYEE